MTSGRGLKNKPIALDAMGGDYAPSEIIKGAIEAVKKDKLNILLVGNESVIRPHLSFYYPDISIVHAPEVIDFQEMPVKAIRQKPNSSIVVGIKLLKEGEVSAFVSAGATGAIVSASLFILGRIEGIERPALGLPYRTLSGPAILLDIGANSDCRPEFLLQFAYLGKIYMQRVLNIPQPRIAILNIGEEEGKGNKLVRESFKLLKENEPYFIGNIEGKDIFAGKAEVIVTDGFTGNVLLKAGEGFGEAFLLSLYRFLRKDLKLGFLSLLFSPAIKSFKKQLDYNEYGGAPLLGVKGNVIIAHGRSKARAIRSALNLAQRMIDQGMPSILY